MSDGEEFYDAVPEGEALWGTRTSLPAIMPNRAEFSIWSFLKQCIGKELTKITMPLHFNEPLSFLQRIAEYVEYDDLLSKAAAESDPIRRLELVTAFAVSGSASNWDRLGKPFNPILGETYEFENASFKIVCEQVSHHPPVSAFYVQGKGYTYYGCVWPKLSFWGKTAEVEPRGVLTVEIPAYGDVFTWHNVNCCVHNIIVGKLWVEHKGKMRVTNQSTGHYADLVWRPTGWFQSESQQRVDGYIYNGKGEKLRAMYGRWTECMFSVPVHVWKQQSSSDGKKKLSSKETEEISKASSSPCFTSGGGAVGSGGGGIEPNMEDGDDPKPQLDPHSCNLQLQGQVQLWTATRRPTNSAQYYNFTLFAMRLNEMTDFLFDKCILPPTDCRFRPDLRLMERGNLDEASKEKVRLEEKQREARRQMETYEASTATVTPTAVDPAGAPKAYANGSNRRTSAASNATPAGNAIPSQALLPLWFDPGPLHNVKKQIFDYRFNNKYFRRDWTNCPDLY